MTLAVSAEFSIEIGRKCEYVANFDGKFEENGAEMPEYYEIKNTS